MSQRCKIDECSKTFEGHHNQKYCSSVCKKMAKSLKAKRYYSRHASIIIEKVKAYREENLEKVRQNASRYYEENKEEIRARVKRYNQENPQVKANSERKRRAQKRGAREARLTTVEWEHILELFNYECVYCGSPWEDQDHFVPLSKGGTHTADNVVPACGPCNGKKHNKNALEFIGCGRNGSM